MTEAELQRAVLDCAHAYRWLVAHFRPARTEHGWRTPVEAEGKGFPDLVMVRQPRLIVVELKGDKGKPTEEQRAWLTALIQVTLALDERLGQPGPILVQLWTPVDWRTGAIERALR